MPTLTPTALTSLTGYKLQASSTIASSALTPSTVGISAGSRDFYGDAMPVLSGRGNLALPVQRLLQLRLGIPGE
ncbi:MAG: hypothetical protein QOI76_4237 [Frankiales bacterium]|nr:hypothetical protein [Frankiales bacterium]